MTQTILNPAKLPSDLNPAEKKFAACLANGEPCSFLKDPNAPVVPKAGAPDNTIRSEVIRFFAYGGGNRENREYPVLGSSIELWGAWISGDLDLTHANIPYALFFAYCHFADSVVMQHAECAALNLSGSRLVKGLTADGLTTKGDVNLRDGFSAEGEVRLLGANTGGDLDCVGGKFHNPNGYALSADGLTVKGSVNLRAGFSAKGEVSLLGASIGGSLSSAGGKFHNPNGCALSADGLTAKGSVNLCAGFSAKGEVRLLGANTGVDLDCVGGKFHNPNGCALNADGLTTKGNVNLRDGFSAKGEVRLLSASVGGNLDCVGGEFHNPNGYAIAADGLMAKGDVHLRADFSADGEVRLLGASIGGNLDCVDGKFRNPNGYALNVQNGNINGGLLWRKASGDGVVFLGYAKAGVLVDELDSWKPFKVDLDGFTYDRFFEPADVKSRIEWLANRPAGKPFSPLPYEQAAKVLFGMGYAREAREILLEKERLQTKDERTPWHHKIGRRLWDVLAGYGYRLRYTAAWMAFFFLFGAAVFAFADYHGNIVPTHPVVTLSEGYQAKVADTRPTRAVPPEYPAFNPVVFSLDVFTPSAVFHQEDSWGPRSGGGDWLSPDFDILWLLTGWYWFQVLAGWVLVPLFLLSVTGVLRPRQSSGEKG